MIPLVLLTVILRAQPAAFEVASVKAAGASDPRLMRGGPGTREPSRFVCSRTSLRDLVSRAWKLKPFALAGPNSMDDAFYNITAPIPPGTSDENFYLMLQHLLEERLGLQVHHEDHNQTVFDMVVAKGGSKLPAAAPADRSSIMLGSAGPELILTARMQSMPQLVNTLEAQVGHRVIDKTGLTGPFDYVLRFLPESAKTAADAATGDTIFEALVQQLGLKLESRKGVVDVLVVDRFHKVPAEN